MVPGPRGTQPEGEEIDEEGVQSDDPGHEQAEPTEGSNEKANEEENEEKN
jgi:hypothetical protein